MSVNGFQIIVLAVLGSLLVLTVVAMVRRWVTRREGVAWTLVWLAASVAMVWPGILADLARGLGIGRGADLLLYCTVVVVLCGFMMVYVRLRHIRRDVTQLVRELAIRDAIINSDGRG
jgi:hypothetical protein